MIKYLIEKEFKQMRRNSFVPRMLVAMPLLMMFVYPWAATQEIESVHLAVVDNDRSATSERLVRKITASDYFRLAELAATFPEALHSVEAGRADIILEIAPGFERDVVAADATVTAPMAVTTTASAPASATASVPASAPVTAPPPSPAKIMIAANAVDGTRGTLGTAYLSSIINDYAEELRVESGGVAQSPVRLAPVSTRYRFNPRLDYKVFMVPALMVMLLTLLNGFLPALSIVGEKEAGTIEQMNVTPVRRLDFVLAKLIPYWVVGFLELGLCMVLAAAVYGIYPAGDLLTILLFTGIYILVVSGLGLVISNYSDTMQQAMFVMFFFVMILILMSGLFTPVGSMPRWAQAIAAANPLKYFIEVMRLVYLKGSGLGQLLPQLAALCTFAAVFNLWAIASYRKSN